MSLPSSASAELQAKTVNGRISNGFGIPVNRHRFVGSDLSGTLGSGGARIEVHTVNGTIDIQPL